ncbi:hypothetical protein [Labrys miyagiensis]|uniref:hypothetical protein n=1 Tax=Labrys miyagiensis TaxID=346912 RepID=UPI0024E1974F|nr:hypothetical protein [Labrys miyagiensis]
MSKTREHLVQPAFTIGLLSITLSVAMFLFDLGMVDEFDAIQIIAPAFLYAFSLWLWGRRGLGP